MGIINEKTEQSYGDFATWRTDFKTPKTPLKKRTLRAFDNLEENKLLQQKMPHCFGGKIKYD